MNKSILRGNVYSAACIGSSVQDGPLDVNGYLA